MRWFIISSFLIPFQFSLAQNYVPFPTQAIWRVDVHSCVYCLEDIANCYCSRYQYEIDGDTISGIHTYKKLRRSGVNMSTWNPVINEYAGAFRQDIPNKKVYYLIPDSTTDTLLYDFDLEIGDTLPPSYTYVPNNNVVIGIDSIIIGGQYHKRFELTNQLARWLIEGVGSDAGLLETTDQFETSYDLICFIRDGMWYYQFQALPPNQEQCDIITALEEIGTSLIDISPNPTPGLFTLTTPSPNSTITIYDVLGNCLLKKNCTETSPQFDLSNQSKGLYFVEIVSDGERGVKKIVVQ